MGMAVLLTAILANVIAGLFGLTSWYDLTKMLYTEGSKGLRKIRLIDWTWLLVLYPLLLGLGAKLGATLYELIKK